MSTFLKSIVIPIAATTLVLMLSLVAFSFLLKYTIGWDLFTAFFFWFLMVPMISVEVPKMHRQGASGGIAPIVSVILFYLFVIFMIYSHYRTDFFIVMIVSLGLNSLVLSILSSPQSGSEATE